MRFSHPMMDLQKYYKNYLKDIRFKVVSAT